MAQRAQRSLEAAKKAVPEGTFAVGIGLAVTGITTYVLFVACARGLSESDYAAVIGGLWPLVFVVAPGCFLPLEQEVGRALAHRRSQNIGGRAGRAAPRRCVVRHGGGCCCSPRPSAACCARTCSRASLASSSASRSRLITYAAQHLTRGTLSGNGRFGPYGVILGVEGCIRLLPAAILWFAGVTDPVAYGLASRSHPFSRAACRSGANTVSSSPARNRRGRALDEPRIPAERVRPRPELELRHPDRDRPRHQFAACGGRGVRLGFFLARALIILFQAVQQRCSRSSRLAGAGEHEDFKNGLRKLVLIVIGVGVIGVVGVFVLGPWAVQLFFDKNISGGEPRDARGRERRVHPGAHARPGVDRADGARQGNGVVGRLASRSARSLVAMSGVGVELFLRGARLPLRLPRVRGGDGGAAGSSAAPGCPPRASSGSWRASSTSRSRSDVAVG